MWWHSTDFVSPVLALGVLACVRLGDETALIAALHTQLAAARQTRATAQHNDRTGVELNDEYDKRSKVSCV